MSRYDDFLQQIKRQHNMTVKSAISTLYSLLKEEDPNLSRDDMYDRIMKDCLEIWRKDTIMNNMIDELKDPERQQSGRKGRQKQLVSVTNGGSVAHDSGATSENMVTNLSGNYETEKHQTYESNHNGSSVYFSDADAKREAIIEEQRLRIGRLEEQLKEQKEHFGELIKSVNNAANVKRDKPEIKKEDSTEVASLKAQLFEITRERDELKQLEILHMRENPAQTFQTASAIKPVSAIIEVDVNDRGKFFKELTHAKKIVYLTVENGKVVGFESDVKKTASATANQATQAA